MPAGGVWLFVDGTLQDVLVDLLLIVVYWR